MLEVKVSPEGEVIGYASLFGGPADAVNDVVQPGAYRASLTTGLPLMLREHKGAPIGQWIEAAEDDIGLKVRGVVTDPATLADLRGGRLDGLSIGYVATKAHRDTAGRRVLVEVNLQEVSIVRRPASSRARVLSVKSTPAAGTAIPKESTMEDETTAPDLAALETKTAELVAGVETKMTAAITAALAPITDRLGKVETTLRRPGAAPAPEKKGDDAPERKAFETYLRGGTAGMEFTEVKALRTGDDPSAGYLAPAEFIAEVDKNIVLWSPVRQLATVRNTARGSVELPKRIGRPTATWVEELEDREDTETGSRYGKSAYEVKELTAYVDVSFSTLEDAAVDIFGELAGDLAEEFGQAEGEAFVTGNGVKRPMGFMSDSSIPTVASGDAAKITADSLIDLFHALPSPYRTNAVWGMNSTTLGAIRKLKTTGGEYLLSMSGLAGSPVTTILGRPVVELPDMPDVAGDAVPLVFGDFAQGYRVFDRVGFFLLRDDLTQRTKGKCRFHARKRVAGGVRKSEALRKLRIAAN
ncbi:phage major capsid protein [Azospirillum sp. A26]|uniref:phage major capsid protein n=1 Tax=Azospirillum sp. A26 TaxID=3160607 RepID=UPI003670F60A